MFAVIRRYNTHENSAQKIEQRVREGFVPIVSRLPGFVSYDVVRSTDGTLLSVSVFESRQAADDSNRLASDWVHENLASLIRTAPVILSGDVIVHHACVAQAAAGAGSRARTPADQAIETSPPPA
jgi:heme-degrading monooxygenase HmoA